MAQESGLLNGGQDVLTGKVADAKRISDFLSPMTAVGGISMVEEELIFLPSWRDISTEHTRIDPGDVLIDLQDN